MHGGVEMGLPGVDRVDRGLDLLGAGVLGQVAPGSGLQGGHDRVLVRVGGQDQDPGGRQPLAQLRGGGDAVGARHPQVHQDHIGAVLLGQAYRFGSVAGGADDLHVVDECHQHAQPVPDDPLVIGDQDPDRARAGCAGHPGTSSSTSHPPAVGPARAVPPARRARSRIAVRPCPPPAPASSPGRGAGAVPGSAPDGQT